MALRWSASHYGAPTTYAYDGGYLVAQVARYDSPQPHWRAYLLGEPVNGPLATVEEAQRIAARAFVTQHQRVLSARSRRRRD